MTRTSFATGVLVVLVTCTPAAADKGIHITGASTVGFMWVLTDGAGYRWDIYQNGTVNDGTNNAYDGGMNLSVGGSSFSAGSRGRLSKDGREVEIGPWNRGGGLQVWRRIYIDPKLGYCRWIDIFQNTGSSAYSAAVRYYSNLGASVQQIVTTGGKARLTAKDWGFVDSYVGGPSSRPTLVHVFAARGAKVKPAVQWTRGSDNIYYRMTLTVPAGKTVALCFFEAQRRPQAKAVAFLKSFEPARELRKVPPALRRIIVNMPGAVLALGAVDLPRDEKLDLAVLRDETEQLGSILMDKYVIETFYGKIELPLGRVMGAYVPSGADTHVHLLLTDGQIAAGKLLNGPIRFRLANGNEMSLPPSKLRTIAYRISKERPAELRAALPLVALRSGQRLRFQTEDANLTFHTEYGDLKLRPDDLASILLDTAEGGLHRAVFRNGSVLSGLLVAETLKARLELGPTLEIRRHLIGRFHFAAPGDPAGGLVELTLRNGNTLYGRIAEKAVEVRTRFGSPTITPAEIAEFELVAGSLDRVRIKLHNGTTVRGRLTSKTLRFQIQPGPELPIFVGHITRITCPSPAGKTPVKKVTTPPTEVKVVAERLAGHQEELKKALAAQLAHLKELEPRAKYINALIAKNPTDNAGLAKSLARYRAKIAETKAQIAGLRAQLSRNQALRDKQVVVQLTDRKELAELSARLRKLEATAEQLIAKIAENPKDRTSTLFLDRIRKLIDKTKARIAELRKALAATKPR